MIQSSAAVLPAKLLAACSEHVWSIVAKAQVVASMPISEAPTEADSDSDSDPDPDSPLHIIASD